MSKKIAQYGKFKLYYNKSEHQYELYWEGRELVPFVGSLTEIMDILLHKFNFDDFAEIVKQVNTWQKEEFPRIY